MADVVANLEFQFTAQDKASPVATKAAENMDAVAAVMADSATSVQESAQTVADGLAKSAESLVKAADPMADYVDGLNTIALKDEDFKDSVAETTKAVDASTASIEKNKKSLMSRMAEMGFLVGTWTGLGKAATGVGKGFSSLFSTVKDSKFIQSIGTGVGKAFDGIKTPKFIQAIGKDVSNIGVGIGKGVSAMTTGVTKATGLLTIGLKSALGFLSPILDLVTGVFGPALEQLSDTLSAVLEPVSGAILEVTQKLLPSMIAVFEPIMGVVLAGIQRVADVLLKEDSPFLKIFQSIFMLFEKLSPVFDQLLGGIASYAGKILPALEKLADTFIKVLSPILETVINAVVQIYDLIAPLVVELLQALEPALKEVGEVVQVLLKELIPVLMPLIKAAIEIIKPLLPITVTLIKLLATLLIPLIKLLAPLLVYVAKFIELIATKLGGLLQSLAKQMELGLSIFKEWIKPIVEWISTTWTDFFGNFDQNMEDMGKWFEDLGKTIKGWADDVGKWFSDLWTSLTKGWEDFSKTVTFIWDNLGTLVSTGFKEILNTTLIDPVNKVLESLRAIDVPLAGKIFEGVQLLPKFAKGGIVSGFEDKGGLPAIIGEAGPEAVIPLNRETLQQIAPPVPVAAATSDESVDLLTQILEIQKRIAEMTEEYIMGKRGVPVGGR